MKTLWCSDCKQNKPTTEFYRNSAKPDGYCDRCKVCERAYDKTKPSRLIKYRKLFIEKMGSQCAHCGFADIRALQIDHKRGGGRKEIRGFGSNWRSYYKQVLENKDDKYQLLCANCNWIKRFTNREV